MCQPVRERTREREREDEREGARERERERERWSCRGRERETGRESARDIEGERQGERLGEKERTISNTVVGRPARPHHHPLEATASLGGPVCMLSPTVIWTNPVILQCRYTCTLNRCEHGAVSVCTPPSLPQHLGTALLYLVQPSYNTQLSSTAIIEYNNHTVPPSYSTLSSTATIQYIPCAAHQLYAFKLFNDFPFLCFRV